MRFTTLLRWSYPHDQALELVQCGRLGDVETQVLVGGSGYKDRRGKYKELYPGPIGGDQTGYFGYFGQVPYIDWRDWMPVRHGKFLSVHASCERACLLTR